MTPRDILLGEQTDINEVSTILGKCKVVRLKPETQSSTDEKNRKRSSARISKSQGAFFCRYNISILPPAKTKGKGKITITPYAGPEEDDNDSQEQPSKKPRIETKRMQEDNVKQDNAEDTKASTKSKNGTSVDDDEDDDSSLSTMDRRTRKKAPISEGNATLRIKVGQEHQAKIPSQMNKRKYQATRKPIRVWKPKAISDDKLNSYLTDAINILKDYYMSKTCCDMTRSLPHNIPTGSSANDPEARLSSLCAYREVKVDYLLYLLDYHEYDIVSTLGALRNRPKLALFLWSKEDKALYNAGFQSHASNLHLISKNVENKNESKNRREGTHKEVVDYHYRFKIPDQFKRFQELKREQARRILEAGERLRLNEYLSEGGNQNGNGSNNGMKKNQYW